MPLLFVYLGLFLLESLIPGIVSNNFDLNYLVYLFVFVGLISVLSPNSDEAILPATKIDFIFTAVISAFGGLLVYLNLDLGSTLRIVVSIIASSFIFLIAFLAIAPSGLSLPTFRPHSLKVIVPTIALAGIFLIVAFNQSKVHPAKISSSSNADLIVKVLNCPGDAPTGANLAKYLIKAGYLKTFVGNANPAVCSGGTVVYFTSKDASQSENIVQIASQFIPIVQKAPSDESSAGTINVIVNSQGEN